MPSILATSGNPLTSSGVFWQANVADVDTVILRISEIGSAIISAQWSDDNSSWTTIGDHVVSKGVYNYPATRKYFRFQVQVYNSGSVNYDVDFSILSPQYGSGQVRVHNRRAITAIGDSITYNGYGTTTVGDAFQALGYLSWVPILTRQKVVHKSIDNMGLFGDLSYNISNRIQAVINSGCGIVVVHAGTNDTVLGTPAKVIDNLDRMYSAFIAAGIIVIAVPIIPRLGTLASVGFYGQVNRWIYEQQKSRSNFYIADANASLTDQSTGVFLAGLTTDGTHPNSAGAYIMGKAIADVINVIFPDTTLPTFVNPSDLYDATLNPGGNLLVNGLMTGTGGTGIAGGVSGVLATSFLATGGGMPSGGTAVLSKSTLADGRPAQQVVLGGAYTGASQSSLILSQSAVFAQLNVGDIVEAQCEVEVDVGGANVAPPSARLVVSGGGLTKTQVSLGVAGTSVMPTGAYKGILRTPRCVVHPGATACTFNITQYFADGAATAALTFRFGAVSIRKVNVL
jgi:lysophospholipase L1-like esterase